MPKKVTKQQPTRAVPRAKAKKNKGPKQNGDQRMTLAKQFNSTYRSPVVGSDMKGFRGSPSLSKCALKLALAISSPFHVGAQGVCLPTVPAPPSHKTSSFIRGTAFIGTAGVGYVMVTPSLAANMPALFATTAAFAGTTTAPLTAVNVLAVGVLALSTNNVPYVASNFTLQENGSPNINGRVVSTGLSVQYVGTLMNTSGVAYSYRDPNHNNVTLSGVGANTAHTAASLGSRAETSVCPFTSAKCTVVDFASEVAETAYQDPNRALSAIQQMTAAIYPYSKGINWLAVENAAPTTFSVNGVNVGSPTSVILFTGVPGSAVQFEYIQHCEYTGPSATALLSPTESDFQGLSQVLAASETLVQRQNAQPSADRWDLLRDSLSAIAQAAKPFVVPAMEKAVMAMLM